MYLVLSLYLFTICASSLCLRDYSPSTSMSPCSHTVSDWNENLDGDSREDAGVYVRPCCKCLKGFLSRSCLSVCVKLLGEASYHPPGSVSSLFEIFLLFWLIECNGKNLLLREEREKEKATRAFFLLFRSCLLVISLSLSPLQLFQARPLPPSTSSLSFRFFLSPVRRRISLQSVKRRLSWLREIFERRTESRYADSSLSCKRNSSHLASSFSFSSLLARVFPHSVCPSSKEHRGPREREREEGRIAGSRSAERIESLTGKAALEEKVFFSSFLVVSSPPTSFFFFSRLNALPLSGPGPSESTRLKEQRALGVLRSFFSVLDYEVIIPGTREEEKNRLAGLACKMRALACSRGSPPNFLFFACAGPRFPLSCFSWDGSRPKDSLRLVSDSPASFPSPLCSFYSSLLPLALLSGLALSFSPKHLFLSSPSADSIDTQRKEEASLLLLLLLSPEAGIQGLLFSSVAVFAFFSPIDRPFLSSDSLLVVFFSAD